MQQKITPEVIDTLTRLLNYLELDEEKDYQRAPEHDRANHIYGDICFLRGWLDSVVQDTARPIRGSRRK